MQKLKSVILILLIVILCGCSTISTNMQINKDKSMNITYLITLDKDYLGNKTFNELFSSKNINYLKNNGYSVTDYEDEDNFGYKVSANIKDIDTISQADNLKINLYDLLYSDIQNELYIFSREEKILKNKYTADFYVNLTDALSNNATDVSDDGKTLTWEFDNIMSGTNNINFTFELYNKQALIVLYVFIGLAGLIALSLIVKIFSWIGDASNKLIKSFYEKAQKDLE